MAVVLLARHRRADTMALIGSLNCHFVSPRAPYLAKRSIGPIVTPGLRDPICQLITGTAFANDLHRNAAVGQYPAAPDYPGFGMPSPGRASICAVEITHPIVRLPSHHPLRQVTLDRNRAAHRRAVHQAPSWQVVILDGSVLHRAIVPYQQVPGAPLVPIDEGGLNDMIRECRDQRLRFLRLNALDANAIVTHHVQELRPV